MKGWCPVHDRVVTARRGRCPECGTPLVDVTQRPPPTPAADPVGERASGAAPGLAVTSPVVAIVLAVAIVALTFAAGLTAGRRRSAGTTPAVTGGTVHQAFTSGGSRTGADVTLRLDRFTQTGRTISFKVSVVGDAIPGYRVGRITVQPRTAGEQVPAQLVTVGPAGSGFEGSALLLDRDDVRVTGLEIQSISVFVGDQGSFPVDVHEIWPPARSGPRSKALSETVAPGDGRTFRLRGIVTWPDRIEALIDVRGDHPGWVYDETFGMVYRNAGEIDGTIVTPTRPGTREIVFTPLTFDYEPYYLPFFVSTYMVPGHWLWTLPGR